MEDQEIKPTEGTPEEASPEAEVSANGFRTEPAAETESQEADEASASGELGIDEAASQEAPVEAGAETGQPARQEATVSADEVTANETATQEAAVEAQPEPAQPEPVVSMEDWLASEPPVEPTPQSDTDDAQTRAVLEAIVYVAEDPLTLAQIAAALQQPVDRVRTLMEQLVAEFERPEHGVSIREVASGYKMATKPEHHDAVRAFVKSLKPPLKLSLPALETLAVIAYKQPVTAPEIMEIRGVQGAGVLKTLLDRKLIAAAGRKNVIGKPILYKTTKEFLIQFGLKDLTELPTLKEFEEIRRLAFAESEPEPAPPAAPAAAMEPQSADTVGPAETSPEPEAGSQDKES
jgi:segregation and condensation protein B